MLNLLDSFKHLGKLPVAKHLIVKSESDLSSLNFSYWLKVNLSEHKVEKGAVIKCSNLEQARDNLKLLRKKFPTETIIMQESVEGIELVLGIKQDKAFGKLLMLGFGGTSIEIVKDITFTTAPSEKREIEKALSSLKLYPSLVTRKKYALDKFIDLAEKVSNLELKEADFNPVILNESSAVIVDSRIVI